MSKLKYLTAVLPAAVAISLLGYGGFPAAAEEHNTKTLEKTIESTDPEVDASALFTEEYNDGGILYKLVDVSFQIISESQENKEETIVVDQDVFYDASVDESKMKPETIEVEGVTYYLQDAELQLKEVKGRTLEGESEIPYEGVEQINDIPTTGEVTIVDETTGQSYKRELPLTGYQVDQERWVDDFSFPIKIYSYDADHYLLGEVMIPKGTVLSEYGVELLDSLGLSSDYYKVNNVTLVDEPYEYDGELIQQAMAYGSRKVADVTATYAGSYTLPSVTGWYYQCTYSNKDPDKAIDTVYTIKVTATYEQEQSITYEGEPASQEQHKSLLNRLFDFITNPVTLAVLLIFIFIIIVLMLFKRKKKKTESGITYIRNSERKEK